MDEYAGIKNNIELEVKSKPLDIEKVAWLYIDLEKKTGPLNYDDLEKAGSWCHRAVFAAYGTRKVENIFLFSKFSRRFNKNLERWDRVMQSLNGEAIALRLVGKSWISPLNKARQLYRTTKKLTNSDEVKQGMNKTYYKIIWGLALYYKKTGRIKRAIGLMIISIQIIESINNPESNKKKSRDRFKAEEILGLLYFEANNNKKALVIFKEVLDTAPISQLLVYARNLAEILFSLGLYEKANPYIDLILSSDYKKKPDPGTLRLLLIDAVNKNYIESAEKFYKLLQNSLIKQQKNFIIPDNLAGFLGNFTSIYSSMLKMYWKNNKTEDFLKIVQDSFWAAAVPLIPVINHSKMDLYESSFKEKKSIKEKKQVYEDSNPGFELKKNELHFIFFTADDCIYKIKRTKSETFYSRIESVPDLQKTINGFRSACFNQTGGRTLFSMIKKQLYQTLFDTEESNIMQDVKNLYITSNQPLTGIPWTALLDENRVIIRTGTGITKNKTNKSKDIFFSLIESGKTLPSVEKESSNLEKFFPDGLHLRSDRIKKQRVIKLLQECSFFHFSGHGYSCENSPENSGLLIEDPSGTGIISLMEIQSLKLSGIQLVFLNSCSSGYGITYPGEMQMHTAAAFLRAGVKNLIVSLNPIRDSASAEFTSYFYKIFKTMTNDPAGAFFKTIKIIDNTNITSPYIFIG